MRYAIGWLALLVSVAAARAELVTRQVDYRHGEVKLEGVYVFDSAAPGRRPTVLVAHEFAGNGTVARSKAQYFARLGYPTLAIDLYGAGVTPKGHADAAARLGLNSHDRQLIRDRAQAALDFVTKQPQCDPTRVAGVGYGVGGTALLELARTGADLEGVACLHGGLSTPNPADGKKISASVLVLYGSDDALIPLSQLTSFEDEMRAGGVDWQVVRYGGVVHDFTNPLAGRDLKTGRAYDADADQRSALAVRTFLVEVFPVKPAAVPRPAAALAKAAAPAAKGVPEKAMKILEYVDDNSRAKDGYEGGRTFGNFERLLPGTDAQGRRLRYREWDVNPLRPGVNRGTERLVTGSDGSAYYSDDHYRTFKKIR